MLDFLSIDLEDQKTWDLICAGQTKGCFQIDSQLGKSWCRKIRPTNIEELSDVIALIRPGCLEAQLEGKSMTQHYADRKNNGEPITIYHEVLEEILGPTKGILIYQEQAIAIVTKLAGFTAQEADSARKSIGKKLPEEMAKVKKMFLEGCIKNQLVTKTEAEEIFSWIEKSQRYSFNKSHSISYAIAGYWSAYCKANYSAQFFKAYLNGATSTIDPFDEIAALVLDARMFDIYILLPDLRELNSEFLVKNGNIIYGLTSIRGVGLSQFEKLKTIFGNQNIGTMSYYEVLMLLLSVNKAVARNLIFSGACDFVKKSRTELNFILDQLLLLSVEFDTAIENYRNFSNFRDLFKFLSEKTKTKRRKEIVLKLLENIENPPFNFDDDPRTVIDAEKRLLGISLSYNDLDMYNTCMANTTCREFTNNDIEEAVIAMEIMEVREVIVKKGQSAGRKMAFIRGCDHSGMLDNITIFSNEYDEFINYLSPGKSVLMVGKKDKKFGSLVVQKIKVLDV